MARFELIVFDLDGTLVDSLDAKIGVFSKLFSERFPVEPPQAELAYRRYSGQPRRVLFDRIATDTLRRSLSDAEFETLSAEFTRRNLNVLGALPLREGAESALRQLHEQGILLAISSATAPEEVLPRVQTWKLSAFFLAVLGSEGAFRKGSPHIEHLVARTGVLKSQVLAVGDEPEDLRLAREAQVACGLLAGTYSADQLRAQEPDYVLTSISDVVALSIAE